MAYIFKQKLNLSDLMGIGQRPKKVLIHEPEEYLAGLYEHYLRKHNFDIKHCPDLNKVAQAVSMFEPHVLILNCDALLPSLSRQVLLRRLSADFPVLRTVTTGKDAGQHHVGELMAAGVCGHINRRLSRPQDLVLIVKSVLQ